MIHILYIVGFRSSPKNLTIAPVVDRASKALVIFTEKGREDGPSRQPFALLARRVGLEMIMAYETSRFDRKISDPEYI